WGLAAPGPGNAVSLAATPVFDELWAAYPHTRLTASGRAVGLPDGQMGNSEVGHLNLGAGAVVRQDLMRIDDAIADGEFEANQVLREALLGAERVHLLGLVSDGGVHSSLEHLRALIALAAEVAPGADVVVHAFTDGRDTLPHAGAAFLAELDGERRARVGSVIGRYWAMDRDRRWERTQRAYDLLVHGAAGAGGGGSSSSGGAGAGEAPYHAASGEQAVRDAYGRGETDEFIEPTLVSQEARIRPGDSVVCFNFRPDRMREIVRALAEPGFAEVDRGGAPPVARLATLTEYEEGWPYPVAFAAARPKVTLAQVLADGGARQLHVAETEKYPHVTYFFNGGEESPHEGEDRELAPSPRDVPTYDHKPQMSAREAAERFVAAWSRDGAGGGYRFGIVNFANADMVGHTGAIPAAVSAVETVDECLGRVLDAVAARGGVSVVTADHGNADHMLEPDGSPNTAHSLNPVPLILTREGLCLRAGGILADVAPTILDLLGIAQPPEMTGRSLIER
ncbi:MAG TPA: 2,3-bisphosphoglycerate-independent phosphoglycerate mutase, partial [Solirubrobacteraceae bacterium]|nr:2,3-bisphosphoglycerate-independent phosphoglycerate mutase [Solirubrobacteraceae bacterium]